MTSAGALRLVERRGGWTLDRRPRKRGRYVTGQHSNKLLGRPQTASVGQMSVWGEPRSMAQAPVVRSRVVPGEMRTLRLWPVVLGALLALVGLLPAAVAADSTTSPKEKASGLSEVNADLAARSRGIVLELYSLDARLARERARLVELDIRTAEVKAERAAAQQRLGAARRSLAAAHRALARRLQRLYEQGDSDPLAVVLGAASVAEALDSLDSL